MTAPPNPAVKVALKALASLNGALAGKLRVADQGCGKLRHYRILAPVARELFLVDTDFQLVTPHAEGRRTFTVEEFAHEQREKGKAVRVLRDREFDQSNLELDCVFSIAVFDVVVPEVRRSLIRSAARNLRREGWLVVIIPRNDTNLLVRCTAKNVYKDGHVFAHHGIHTFFRNFRELDSLVEACRTRRFALVQDLSTYRQACLLFSKR